MKSTEFVKEVFGNGTTRIIGSACALGSSVFLAPYMADKFDDKTPDKTLTASAQESSKRIFCEGLAKYTINLVDTDLANDNPWKIIQSKHPQLQPGDPSSEQISSFVTVLSKANGEDLGNVIPLTVNMPAPNNGDQVFVPLKCSYVK
jgi:hypothetical protein